jgi:hypothetical protein
MKKTITLLLSVLLLTNIAYASDDLDSLKKDVSNSLNAIVKTLKGYLKKTDEELKESKVVVEEIKEKAQALKEASQKKETNPVVLKQGLAAMPNCNISNQELAWSNDKWICRTPSYGTDCYPAKDEYRYEQADGSMVCSKSPKGSSINYYWKFRGYTSTCDSQSRKSKIYGCYYKNKNNQEVEVADSNCASATKSAVEERICYANWIVGPWVSRGCNASCNRPKRRSVSCPANNICIGPMPPTTGACSYQGSCSYGGS